MACPIDYLVKAEDGRELVFVRASSESEAMGVALKVMVENSLGRCKVFAAAEGGLWLFICWLSIDLNEGAK